jgi:hypothetical protein
MPVELHETHSLIGSDQVQGTAVFDADGTKIGAIERIMIDKLSGKVAYAVLSFGGFLGVGDEHRPLPWAALKYNTELGGYQILIPIGKLETAPTLGAGGDFDWNDERLRGLGTATA